MPAVSRSTPLPNLRGMPVLASLKRGGVKDEHAPVLRYFRGITAPASLKLGHPDAGARAERTFRGIAAPASLKRHVRRYAEVSGDTLFRGIAASASLKHVPARRQSRFQAQFRGITAPASLKRPHHVARGQEPVHSGDAIAPT
jgi:hypothetical protein